MEFACMSVKDRKNIGNQLGSVRTRARKFKMPVRVQACWTDDRLNHSNLRWLVAEIKMMRDIVTLNMNNL